MVFLSSRDHDARNCPRVVMASSYYNYKLQTLQIIIAFSRQTTSISKRNKVNVKSRTLVAFPSLTYKL